MRAKGEGSRANHLFPVSALFFAEAQRSGRGAAKEENLVPEKVGPP